MSAIDILPEKCSACRICELACSHHHVREFGRQLSSIEILKINPIGKVAIKIYRTARDGHRGCDRCVREERPQCVAWCPTQALVTRQRS